MSHEKQKKEAQICRRWFISTHMYIGKCEFWVVARKAEKWGPNSPPLIYFHAHVYWKMWILSCRTKIRKKRPKFAAIDLFSRASIEKRFSKAVFTNFARSALEKTAFSRDFCQTSVMVNFCSFHKNSVKLTFYWDFTKTFYLFRIEILGLPHSDQLTYFTKLVYWVK